MTSRIERLRALEKAVELVAKATPGPWRWSENGNLMAAGDRDVDEICAVYTERDDEAEPKNAAAIRAAVNFIREHGSALIAELGQEVGAVAGRVETGVVQFGDDWPGVFIRGDNAFATAMHLRGEDSVWRNAAIKSLAELLESCNVANNPNVRVIPSPAHTSEARDAATSQGGTNG